MIQLRSVLVPADNSGAKHLNVIGLSHKIGKFGQFGGETSKRHWFVS